MSEKGFFGSIEGFSRNLIGLAIGIGALALGIRYFRESFSSPKKKTEPKE